MAFDVGYDYPEQSPQMRGLRDVSVRMFFSLKATHTSEWRRVCRAVCSATWSLLRGSRKELSRVSACLQFRESPAQPLRSCLRVTPNMLTVKGPVTRQGALP